MKALRDVLARGTGTFALWIAAALALSIWTVGCGDSDTTGPDVGTPEGKLVGRTGCKTWEPGPGGAGAEAVARNEDCIVYEYEHRTLRLKHVNAAFNCCPEMVASVVIVHGDTILITERETQGLCHCLCLYDLRYEIRHLDAGTYRVVVKEEYLLEGDEPLEFTMDLVASPSGSYCVVRDHYPWTD